MAVKLIASDLDGTLLTNKKELSPRTREALDLAAAQGIYLVPATGRSFESVPEMIREYPGVEYLITANGGAVYSVSEKKRIYQCLMTPESVEVAIAVRKKRKNGHGGRRRRCSLRRGSVCQRSHPLSGDRVRGKIYQGNEDSCEGYH